MNIYFYDMGLNETFYAQYILKGLINNGNNVMTKKMVIAYDDQGNKMVVPEIGTEDEARRINAHGIDFILFMGFAFTNHIKAQCVDKARFLPDLAKRPYAVLFYDDPRRYLEDIEPFKEDMILICCDSNITEKMVELGFNAHYLPCCYDPEIQFPRERNVTMEHNIAFAGSCFSEEMIYARRQGLSLQDIDILNQLRDKRTPGKYYDYNEILRSIKPRFTDWQKIQQCALMEEKHYLRMDMFKTLSDMDLHIYGQGDFKGFRGIIQHNENLNQHTKLPHLYSNAKINISVELLPASVHQRIFECVPCGGFPLLEKKADNAKCFDTYVEWETLDELKDKAKYYLENESERKAITEKMMKEAEAKHTNTVRAKQLGEIIGA